MLGLLTKAKAWGWVIASAVLAILAAVARIRILEHQRDKARQQAKVAKAGLQRKAETEERETESAQEWSDYKRAAEENLDEVPTIISDPNRRRR